MLRSANFAARVPASAVRTSTIRPALARVQRQQLLPLKSAALASSPFALSQNRSFSWTPWRTSTSAAPVDGAAAGAEGGAAIPTNQSTLAVSETSRAASTPAATTPVAETSNAAAVDAVNAPAPTPSVSTQAADAAAISDATLAQPPALATNPTLDQLIAQNPDNLAEVLNSPEAVHAAMRVGDLKLMGLEHSMLNPAGWLRDAMEAIHVGIGLPWWATIASITICLRLALFPLVARMQANGARLAAIQPQTAALMSRMSEAKKANDTQAMGIYTRQLQQLFAENNCHPLYSLSLPLLQVPLFMTFFFAVRGMAMLPVPQFKEGGLAWFTDLTLPDPFYILPITSVLFQLGVLEMGADGNASANQTRQGQHMKNVFRVISVAFIPVVGGMASAMTFYWTLSAALTLLQARTLKAPTIRRLMKLPIIKPAPPPPRGTIIEKPPTLRDTLREGREMFMGSIDEAKKKQQAKLDAEAGRVATRVMSSGGSSSSASSSSSLQTQEIVRELPTQRAAQGVVYDAAETTGAGTSGSAASSSSSSSRRGGGNSPVMDAVAQAKANRIAAARARREQQQQQSATGSR